MSERQRERDGERAREELSKVLVLEVEGARGLLISCRLLVPSTHTHTNEYTHTLLHNHTNMLTGTHINKMKDERPGFSLYL